MKKVALITILIFALFLLTACGSGSGATNSTSQNGTSTNSFRSGATGPLNPESKLALGTIKLEGTKLAVDPKMAANLVPLWQLLFQLNSSSSSAPQEVTAVVDQIKTTMAPDQINSINSMSLTQADIFTAFQQQAQASGSGGTTGSGGSSGGNRGGGFAFGGGGPGGGGPGGGGFPGGGLRAGGTGSSTSSTTSSAQSIAQAAQARQNAITNLVINQVIRLLETKLRS
jgi:hypothetical protein